MRKQFQEDLQGKTFKANKQVTQSLRDHHEAGRLRTRLSKQKCDKYFDFPTYGSHCRKVAAFKHQVAHDLEDSIAANVRRGADVLSEDRMELSPAEKKRHSKLLQQKVSEAQRANQLGFSL